MYASFYTQMGLYHVQCFEFAFSIRLFVCVCAVEYYVLLYFLKYRFIYFNWRLITLQYCSGFANTLTWICHGCTCVPHPEPSSHLLPHPIPQGHHSAPALSTLIHALNLDWRPVSHMKIYVFKCYSLKSFCPCLLSQNP